MYDFDRLYEKILLAINSAGPAADRMGIVIDECAAQHPSDQWGAFRKIDYGQDEEKMTRWLSSVPGGDSDRKGLWFGIFNPSASGTTSADMYVLACPDYDPNGIDWVDNSRGVAPASYLNSVVLDKIYSASFVNDGLKNRAEYPLCLAYSCIAVQSLLETNGLPIQLASIQGAAVGFDGGDFIFLGEFDGSRFIANVRPG